MAGGSRIVISDDGITILTNGKILYQAGQHKFEGGQKIISPEIQLPVLGENNQHNLRYLLKDKEDIPFAYHKYIAFMPNGDKVEGLTDENGYTRLFNTVRPEDISIHLYNNEELNIE